MAYIKTYKELIVWQKSILLANEVFILTKSFPPSELYGLVQQIRRAVVSIPSNIAEGYGRKSPNEYAHFISVAYGSALEVETQLILSRELVMTKKEEFSKSTALLEEVLKMLNKWNTNNRNKLIPKH